MSDVVNIPELAGRTVCDGCIHDEYLRGEIRRDGDRGLCHYCGTSTKCISLGALSDRIEKAFAEHYARSPEDPTSYEYAMHNDPECDYSWEREGEPVVDAIANAVGLAEQIASDVQQILADRYFDFDEAAAGQELEYSDDAFYVEKGVSDDVWLAEWSSLERTLATESRFFSQSAYRLLERIFDRIEDMRTVDQRALIVDAGPGTMYSSIFRARCFQSDEKLLEAIKRPDLHLGPPPSTLAQAGRMNALGISVFYGATNQETALAEVRPPVASRVLVGQFDLVRPARLLDLMTLRNIARVGSVLDPEFAPLLERIAFLNTLSHRLSRAVMPDDENFEYLSTQAVSDYLAALGSPSLDGIIFPSSQVPGEGHNVVLFHKASRVAMLEFPVGTVLTSSLRYFSEDGEEEGYLVIEKVPRSEQSQEGSSTAVARAERRGRVTAPKFDTDRRSLSLVVDVESLIVHSVEAVAVTTMHSAVRRRWE